MSNGNKNILVVDDVKDLREGISHVLQDEGYNVSTASNGVEALRQLKTQSLDLVITDILMPEMDGMELVTRAKAFCSADLKFILISGGGRKLPGDDYNYLEVTKKLTGVNTLLKKPFKPEDLLEKVANILSE